MREYLETASERNLGGTCTQRNSPVLPVMIPGATCISSSPVKFLWELNVALIVPESSLYGAAFVEVTGAGSRAVPHASDSVSEPNFGCFSGATSTFSPNAIKDRL